MNQETILVLDILVTQNTFGKHTHPDLLVGPKEHRPYTHSGYTSIFALRGNLVFRDIKTDFGRWAT